ncbi:acetylornithine transaminase [Thermodesulfitimonas autotrophica]|nr:acetylornithine transaminase [Thermodesulfitimonas autotrophica]
MKTYGRLPLVLVRGAGVRVWDAAGREYLDFVAGLAVNSLGHCHPRVVAAIREQAGVLMHCSNLYYSVPQTMLARWLVEHTPYDRVFFCNSGAEAVEGALKLARKYAKKRWGEGRFEIVTALNSFHGRTYGAVTATGQPKYHQGFEPLVPGFRYVPFNDVAALEAAVTDKTAAVLLEPVQGEGGVYPATDEFIRVAWEICQQRGALLIFDEVQCGLGRTGRFLAQEHYGVTADITCLAKALGGGFPIGALLATEEVASAFAPGDHASTFGGNPLAAAAALAALRAIEEEGLVANAVRVGSYFREALERLRAQSGLITEVRGLGLMLGVVVKVPAKQLVSLCQERGLIVNAVKEDTLRFVPPLTISREDVDRAVAILQAALTAAVREIELNP